MTQVVTVGESKDAKPPSTWGVIEWQMPDGMNAAKAQKIMQAFVEYTHSLPALCAELHVPIGTARIYLLNSASIPKSVAYKIPRLITSMKKNPARAYEIAERVEREQRDYDEMNADAAGRAGRQFMQARLRLRLRQKDVAAATGVHYTTVSKYEVFGATPMQNGFFELCRYYGIEPESFGFVSDLARAIQQWRLGMRGVK